MGLYDDTIAKVLKIVSRPDAKQYATMGMEEAILFLHRQEKFARDLREQFLISDTPEYELKIALPFEVGIIEYLRATIQEGTSAKFTVGPYITQKEPSAIYGINGKDYTDFWYMSHNSLNIRSSIKTDKFLLGYFALPKLTSDDLVRDWIFVNWNDLVVMLAVANTFRYFRNWDAAKTYASLAFPEIERMKTNEKYPGAFPVSNDDWGGQSDY